MSEIFMADIGVHNNWRVNKEPAIRAATITSPQPVKKNCHRRFKRLCLKNIIKLRLSPCTPLVYREYNKKAIFIFILAFFYVIILRKRDEKIFTIFC